MANPFIMALGLGLIVYGLWTRHKAMGWTYCPGHWHRRWVFGPISPTVTYRDELGVVHKLHVNRFSTLQEEPLKLLVSPNGRAGHIAGSEFTLIGLGATLCLLQLLTMF